ncbi:hypothetical protein [Rhizobium leguminosarum]
MSEIPEDIMNTARTVAMKIAAVLPISSSDDVDHIAKAIFAERERCASIADAKMYDFGCIAGTDSADYVEICADLAADIRAAPKGDAA